MRRLFTIGFTKASAEDFFGTIGSNGVTKVIDVRLKNESQLSGFTKGRDLPFFLRELCGCSYEHRSRWAPNDEILSAYKKKSIDWTEYESRFNALISGRHIELDVDEKGLISACLLCSEPRADKCHRRLVAERLAKHNSGLEVVHLRASNA